MSVTLTANYKEVLNTETVEKIDELLDENYALDDMLEFIDQKNESWFVKYYEEYVRYDFTACEKSYRVVYVFIDN